MKAYTVLLISLVLCSKVWSFDSLSSRYQDQLLKIRSLSELEALKLEYQTLKELNWSCRKEREEKLLPLHCYPLLKALSGTQFFSDLRFGFDEGALSKHCDAALQALPVSTLEFLEDAKAKLPTGSDCRKKLENKLIRTNYELDTVF